MKYCKSMDNINNVKNTSNMGGITGKKDINAQKSINAKWSKEHEYLLISWAEKASGYAWMHNKSVSLNKKYNLYISIPACIFGYVAGTTTLLIQTETLLMRGFIGVTGILAGILSNFQQMFTFKELGEQHRISCLRFLAFFRDISSELSISTEDRTNPIDYITMKRMEMDIMLEQSPTIPDYIIRLFNEKTRHIGKTFHKPEVANILQTILPFGSLNRMIYSVNDTDYDDLINANMDKYNYKNNSSTYLKVKKSKELDSNILYNDENKMKKYQNLYLLDIYFTLWKNVRDKKNVYEDLTYSKSTGIITPTDNSKDIIDDIINREIQDTYDEQLKIEVANSQIDKSEVMSKTSRQSNFSKFRNSREQHIPIGYVSDESDNESGNDIDEEDNKSSIDKISDKINVIRNNIHFFTNNEHGFNFTRNIKIN